MIHWFINDQYPVLLIYALVILVDSIVISRSEIRKPLKENIKFIVTLLFGLI